MSQTMAGLETCFGRDLPLEGLRDQDKFMRAFERTKQEGRYPLHPVARAKFCYHSLQRICSYYITVASPGQTPGHAHTAFRSSIRRLVQNNRGGRSMQAISRRISP